MKYKMLLLSIALFSCFTAMLYALSNVAFAGSGCGTNWMGDTSGDTDFYVSKNQNLGSSSDMSTSGATSTKKPAATLGTAATRASQTAEIQSLTPDKTSPQAPGTSIVWTAKVTNPGEEQLLYDFLLKGPSTGGLLADETGWTGKSSWRWNTTDADTGENQVEVRIKYASSKDIIASKTESYVIASATPSNKTTAFDAGAVKAEIESHPTSKTAASIGSKTKLAPDERGSAQTTNDDISGPNMKMPDPSPKVTAQSSTESPQEVQQAETYNEPSEREVMQVDGKWTVRFDDASSSMDLILIQTGERVSGWGNLNEQNTKLPLIATGTASENSMNLDVKTVVGEYVNKIDKRFQLNLVKLDRTICGNYQAYSGEDLIGKGNATASRFAS
ncbi:MAG: hypothetical protein GYA39_03360 [Methanothrix sp.]|nr:hypothetical protein [Methanothrix sp.]